MHIYLSNIHVSIVLNRKEMLSFAWSLVLKANTVSNLHWKEHETLKLSAWTWARCLVRELEYEISWCWERGVVTKSCPTLCDPMDCSLPGSSVHGIFQARILEWVAISFSRGSSQPRDQTHDCCIGRRILCHWTTREAQERVASDKCRWLNYFTNREKFIKNSFQGIPWRSSGWDSAFTAGALGLIRGLEAKIPQVECHNWKIFKIIFSNKF